MNKPAYLQQDWFVNGLMREVRASSITRVAVRMGVKRTTLSVFVNGSGEYGTGRAKPDRMEARYRAAFEQIQCPFDQQQVDATHCRQYALCRAPTHNPLKLMHWRMCQACPHRPTKGEPE